MHACMHATGGDGDGRALSRVLSLGLDLDRQVIEELAVPYTSLAAYRRIDCFASWGKARRGKQPRGGKLAVGVRLGCEERGGRWGRGGSVSWW
jgi:hypothetical protein